MKNNDFSINITNVLIIGSGGAGLRAAIEAKSKGVSVCILSKRDKKDAHTVLAAGGINAAFGNLDKNDSWTSHFQDTYFEGYGIGDSETIEIMTKNAPLLVEEIDKWGANFQKLEDGRLDQRFFGAHTHRRTCYSGDFTGKSILYTLINKIKSLDINILDSEYVTEILVENNQCFGAVSFNLLNGLKTIHIADSVILASGGHSGMWERNTSRSNENMGDGYALALLAGCELVDMEMVQFHPTGMVWPEDISGTLVTEAVRGEGGVLTNIYGERFMKNYDSKRMELSTRDKIAMANYAEIIEGRGTKKGGVYLDISHKSKDFIIEKLPRIYRQFIEYQLLDISKEPMEVAPTAHYSMGGIKVNPSDHSTNVVGLYAAGEVAGGLHGANRLGGNSLAEILVFGKITGSAAANYSKNLNFQNRSQIIISKAIENINKEIKNGTEMAKPLQNELGKIMWNCCGVIRNQEKLNQGIAKLINLKKMLNHIDVRVADGEFGDLAKFFDFKFSLISAEATLKSAKLRNESRGSHQRSDFPLLDIKQQVNYKSLIKNKEVEVSKENIKELNSRLKNLIKETEKRKDIKGKLLE